MGHYTSIAYKSNNKMYIGHIKSGLKTIEEFKPLSGVAGAGFSDNMLYIVMISESTPNSALYELDKIPIESVIGLPVLDEIPEEDKILISNKILKDFTGSIVLH